MKRKRVGKDGDITVKNLLGLIIAAAAVFVLFTLFFKLMAPAYDVRQNTVDSYFSSLKTTIQDVKGSGFGEYDVLAFPEAEREVFYFLVYFGDANLVKDFRYDFERQESVRSSTGGDKFGGTGLVRGDYVTVNYFTTFFLGGKSSNTLCVCSTLKSSAYVESSDEGGQDWMSESICNRCIDLDWPVVIKGDSNVFEIGEFDFLNFTKRVSEEGETKYFLEVVK